MAQTAHMGQNKRNKDVTIIMA